MTDLLTYFQEHYAITCLGDITWAHAVNSQQKLQSALNDPQIMFLEVDVSISSNGEVVLAHPPVTDSDLSFAEFIHTMETSRQGVKLDFKVAATLMPCLTILRASNLRQPVLLNAGILQGEGGDAPDFSAASFLAACHDLYPQGILSPDWTNDSQPHTQRMVDEMLAACQGVAQVTFPINARLLPYAWPHVVRLLQPAGYSLTVWDGEPVSEQLLAWLRANTDPARTCYDCFDTQHRRLKWW
jgi:Menorin